MLRAAEKLDPDDIEELQRYAEFRKARHIYKGGNRPQHIVQIKHETRTPLSYTGLAKRAEFLRYAPEGSLLQKGWTKLAERMYGEPVYKQVLRARAQKAMTSRGA